MTTKFEPSPNTGQHPVEIGPGARPFDEGFTCAAHPYGHGTAWAGRSITPVAAGFLAGVLTAVVVVYLAVVLGYMRHVEDQITVLPPHVAYCDTATLPDPGPPIGSDLARSRP